MEFQINKKESIFIAGASGLAGSAICRALKESGYKNLLTPTKKELDLSNYVAVEKWFLKTKPTIVILCAAKVGGVLANSIFSADFILENLKIQTNVIEIAWLNKVKRLIFLGSSCIYPKFASQPIKEESLLNGKLEETNKSYAIAKISGIQLCKSLREQYNFDAICLMPTNLYGPGDNYSDSNSHVLPSLVKKFCTASKNSHAKVICWGSGIPRREFLHSDDLGKATVFLLENWFPGKSNSSKEQNGKFLSIINVGTGKDITIRELAEKIAEFTEFKGEIIWDKSKPDGTPRKLLDVSKIEKMGWKATYNFEDGIKQVIEDFKKGNYLIN